MIKIIGVAILSISSVIIGVSFYQNYKIRPASLALFINLLNSYLLKLKMERKSFCDIVLSCETDDIYICECKKNLINKSPEQAMITQNLYYDNLGLTDDDRLVLQNFLKRTGMGSFKDELTLCTDTLNALNTQLTESKTKLKKSGVFSLKIAFAVALWIAIILL